MKWLTDSIQRYRGGGEGGITNLEDIKASLSRDSLTQIYETSSPVLCCDSLICKNSSDQLGLNDQSLGDGLSSQDDELLHILEDLQN